MALAYLTLPSGEYVFQPSAETSSEPNAHPELTTRLQNPEVQYSPGSTPIMEPSPSPSENTHLGSPTITHSQYLRENINFNNTSTLITMTCQSETGKIQETDPP